MSVQVSRIRPEAIDVARRPELLGELLVDVVSKPIC
jgi:hypothetical protein